jgi:hypothetical protein
LAKLYITTKKKITFWLNHYFFGIAHTQENPKGTVESDDYHQ